MNDTPRTPPDDASKPDAETSDSTENTAPELIEAEHAGPPIEDVLKREPQSAPPAEVPSAAATPSARAHKRTRARARKAAGAAAAAENAPDAPTSPETPPSGDFLASISRRQLRSAFGEETDLNAHEMMRAINEAKTPEDAFIAMAEQAAAQGERLAMTRIIPPTVSRASVKLRHIVTMLSFIIFVCAPTAFAVWYLTERAAPQYASITAFSVRHEDVGSPTDVLGGAFGIASSSTNDTDILYDFLTSQEIVSSIRTYRDLEAIWSTPGTDLATGDPLFALASGGTIEEQTDYWNRMISIAYDTSANILEVRVLAFDPNDAQTLAQDLLNESTKMINSLSSLAQRDVLLYAEEDLRRAEVDLRDAREAATTLRNQYQIASIDTDIALSIGPLNILTQQLVEAKIDRGLLAEETSDRDPRLIQINARIQLIEEQIAEERAKLGASSEEGNGSLLSSRIAEFEQLNVDLEFAQDTYSTALSQFYAARADANRQALYLAAHKSPTLAEQSDYPQKYKISGLVFGLCFAFWGIITLSLLSLRDRR